MEHITIARTAAICIVLIIVCAFIIFRIVRAFQEQARVQRAYRQAKKRSYERESQRLLEKTERDKRKQYQTTERQYSRTTVGWIDRDMK